VSAVEHDAARIPRFAVLPGGSGYGWHVGDRAIPGNTRVVAGPFTSREQAQAEADRRLAEIGTPRETPTATPSMDDSFAVIATALRSLALQADRYDATLATIMADAATLKARVDELERALHDDPGRHSVKA
jgi:hypothetical protein